MPIHCTLLYVESDADLARQFQRRMAAHRMDAIFAATDMAGISALSQHRLDLIVANYRLSGGSGLAVLRAARKSHPGIAAMLLVEPADLKQAGPALQEEHFDYLVKDADGVYLDMLPLMAPKLINQQAQQSKIDNLEQTLSQQHVLAMKAAESNRQGLAIFSADLRLQLWNSRFLQLIGRSSATAISGAPLHDLLRLDSASPLPGKMLGQPEFQFEHPGAADSRLQICGSRCDDGSLVLTCTDAASPSHVDLPDGQHASIDALTGLPGRWLFLELLKHQVQRANRTGFNSTALMLLDIDGFKRLNQSNGNAVCDQLLVEVAHRITGVMRESDVVGRMEGDQFGILAVDVNSMENVEIVAGKLLAVLSKPFQVDNVTIRLTGSIGIVFHPTEPHTSSGLAQMAETALFQAKSAGKSRYEFA